MRRSFLVELLARRLLEAVTPVCGAELFSVLDRVPAGRVLSVSDMMGEIVTTHLLPSVSSPRQRGRSGAGLRREPPLLRSRLKRAASCIARLSREKQQLIEMGNRLRAQVTTAGPQGAAGF